MKMMLLTTVVLTSIFYGCRVQRTSKFTLAALQPGMDQSTVRTLVGKPYKQTFHYGNDSTLFETYYYKEAIWKKNWFEVNNVLQFKNGKLIALEQEEEKHLYENNLRN